MNALHSAATWIATLGRVWRREVYLIFTDVGVMLFFFALPLFYPIVYTLIYNPEVIRNLPVAVVDHSRTAQSRQLARMIDATDGLEVYQYCTDMAAARELWMEKKAFGVLEIPADYARKLGRGEQATVTYFADASLLLRYRTALMALTDVQMAIGRQYRSELTDNAGLLLYGMDNSPVDVDSILLGDPTQGFASFIMPAVLVLILHQSMILGVTMLGGNMRERRRRNGGIDPLTVPAGPACSIIGKNLAYIMIYAPIVIYTLHFVPHMFELPHEVDMWQTALLLLPMLTAAALLGQCLTVMVTERETSMVIVVFSSVALLFLSGITWPRYAMDWFWRAISDIVPATWGVDAFVRMNSNGATLGQESHSYLMLWILSAGYFVLAYTLSRVAGFYGRRLPAAPVSVK